MRESGVTHHLLQWLKKQLGGSKDNKKRVTVLLPVDPEIGSDGQKMAQITPKSHVQSLYGPFIEELDLVLLVDSFQLSVILSSVWCQGEGSKKLPGFFPTKKSVPLDHTHLKSSNSGKHFEK